FALRLPPAEPDERAQFAASAGLRGRSVLVVAADAKAIDRVGRMLDSYLVRARWAHPAAAVAAAVAPGDRPGPIVLVAGAGDEDAAVAALLREVHVPLLVVGGSIDGVERQPRLRHLATPARRSALLTCLRELFEQRTAQAAAVPGQ